MDENPDGEVKEMVEIYVAAGVAEADARSILTTMAKYKEFFVKHMMVLELGLQAPEEHGSPWTKGAITSIAFVAFGCVPLVAYTALASSKSTGQPLVLAFCFAVTGAATFALGALKVTPPPPHAPRQNAHHFT